MAPKKSRKLSELQPGTKDCGGMPPMKRAKTKAKATPPSVADGQSTFVVDDFNLIRLRKYFYFVF